MWRTNTNLPSFSIAFCEACQQLGGIEGWILVKYSGLVRYILRYSIWISRVGKITTWNISMENLHKMGLIYSSFLTEWVGRDDSMVLLWKFADTDSPVYRCGLSFPSFPLGWYLASDNILVRCFCQQAILRVGLVVSNYSIGEWRPPASWFVTEHNSKCRTYRKNDVYRVICGRPHELRPVFGYVCSQERLRIALKATETLVEKELVAIRACQIWRA